MAHLLRMGDLVVAGRPRRCDDRSGGGIASRRDDGAATGRGHLRQFRLHKALIRCARAVHEAGRWAEFGFRLDGLPRAELGAVMERVRRMRSLSSAGDAVRVDRIGKNDAAVDRE